MARPRQMFDHTLDAVKGWIPGNMGSVDFTAKLSANVTIDPVYQGRVVHLNSDGEFEMGCTGDQMAIFLLQNSDDTDVANEGATDDQPISPSGNMTGLVAIGGFELASTEFDADQTYAPNDSLRAVASNSNATTGGRLTNQSVVKVASATPQSATAVCGRVSKGVTVNAFKKSVLNFWPVHIPGAAGL